MTEKPLIKVTPFDNGSLLHLLLDAPKGNTLSMAVLEALDATLKEHQDRKNLKLVIIQGSSGNFSFGASVEEHVKDMAPKMLGTFHRVMRNVAKFPAPIAALVEGRCLGGGFELALCCHFMLATDNAMFGCPEVKLGVFPPVLAAIGAIKLGGALAERLIITGETVKIDVMDRAGIITQRLHTDPMRGAREWFEKNMAPMSALAIRNATQAARSGSGILAALDKPLGKLEERYISHVLPSRDGNEGIQAFLEKRPPKWEDA